MQAALGIVCIVDLECLGEGFMEPDENGHRLGFGESV